MSAGSRTAPRTAQNHPPGQRPGGGSGAVLEQSWSGSGACPREVEKRSSREVVPEGVLEVVLEHACGRSFREVVPEGGLEACLEHVCGRSKTVIKK